MEEKEQKELVDALKNEVKAQFEKEKNMFADKESVNGLLDTIKNASTKEDLDLIKSQIDEVSLAIRGIKENPSKTNKGLIDYIKENSNTLKELKARKKNTSIEFTIKAQENATDIGNRDYLGTIEAGVYRKPVRKTSILDLFPTQSVDSEYLHYWEEDIVTRDAKFVVACATSAHLTKVSWAKRTVELAKVRDMVDICLDMVEDYSFVEGEIRNLINESIQLKKEYELLLGASALATDLISIDSISSEFAPANVLAPFNASFEKANLEQLVDSMSAQIQVFGQENKWMPNAVIMNFTDFVKYRNLKDANGNKLIHTLSDNVATIAGLTVVTSPIVAPNTLYVMDATKGRILQRKGYSVDISYENKSNFEHELATIKAYERLQFYVKNIDQDAFMKCSDIATAITAINIP